MVKFVFHRTVSKWLMLAARAFAAVSSLPAASSERREAANIAILTGRPERGANVRRREFLGLVGAAAAWMSPARAQPIPVVGFLGAESPELWADRLEGFRRGLSDAGFVDGRNIRVDYLWAHGQNDKLPALAAELARREVAVIVAPGSAPAALAAKAATTTIPVIFQTSGDPLALSLVASLNRPGGNVTGITTLGMEIVPKRLELLRELLPSLTSIAVLANPTNPISAINLQELQKIARALPVQLHVVEASTEAQIESAFAALGPLQAGALLVLPDSFLTSHGAMLGALAARHRVPAIYQYRDFVAAGGLMSYGTNNVVPFYQAGAYAARVLKGDKASDLPVSQAVNVELIVNLKAAKALGISVPITLLGRADEIIE
jgi:putative ABC transport system substrate-binding protein